MSVRQASRIALLLATIGASVVEAAETAGREVILVANAKGGTVSVIDVDGFRPACEIDVAPDLDARRAEWGPIHRLVNWYADYKYADDIEVSPDGRILYVSRGSIADVAAFDLKTGLMLWRVPVDGYRVDHLALSEDGSHLFLSVVTGSRVVVLDTESKAVVASIPTGSRPHGIKFSADGERVFIGEMKGNAVTVAGADDFLVRDRLPFEEGVRPFDLTRDGRFLYLQLSNFHGFLEYDLADNRLARRISLPETDTSRAYDGDYPKEAAHHGLSLSRDERMLCIAGTTSNYVALVSRPELRIESLIPVGEQPGWTIQSLDGRYCYVSSRGDNSLSVVSYESRSEVARIPVGDYPQRMLTTRLPAVCDPEPPPIERRPL